MSSEARAATAEDVADGLERRLGSPPTLTFPEDWTLSKSWYRAQRASSNVGRYNPAEWGMVLGTGPGRIDPGSHHRVLFAIYDGELVAECDCDGYRYRAWCAHVAHLWWLWARGRLVVADLDTGQQYPDPPWWLEIDEEAER